MARHRKSVPQYKSGTVYFSDGRRINSINVEWEGEHAVKTPTPEWKSFLTVYPSFSYSDVDEGQFTARRERRRNGDFWFAFGTVKGKTKKLYLGKGEALDHMLLFETGCRFRLLRGAAHEAREA